MLEKIKNEIENWEYHELKAFQKEIKNGSQAIGKLLGNKIKEFEKEDKGVCPVCNSSVDSTKSNTYTLIFGPGHLRKKASFCALDCLHYFVNQFKELNKEEVTQQ